MSTGGLATPRWLVSVFQRGNFVLPCSLMFSPASWYASRFGFDYVAYRGLETGYRNSATWVMRQGKILFAFSSVLGPKAEKELGDDMGRHLAVHGDGVKDVAFTVTDARAMYEAAVKRGAVSIREPVEEKDEHGSVVLATVKTVSAITFHFLCFPLPQLNAATVW